MDELFEKYRNACPGSAKLYAQAKSVFPSGVTHDQRFLKPFPIYVDHASGVKKWDVDGREYIDYWMGHGALILGHLHPEVEEAVHTQLRKGTHYGACHELEIKWGRKIKEMIPCAERVRFTGSGTEATLMAIRFARAYTGKTKILKFEGHFHGWHDQLMPGLLPPFDKPASPGILDSVLDQIIISPVNDLNKLETIFKREPDLAAVILEPNGACYGTIPIEKDFLYGLRDMTARLGVLLIFDEVITGFRMAPGGAQEYYGVTPDLCALAKILAGGLPGGAVAGSRDIIDIMEISGDPDRDRFRRFYHPGTYNANPLSASAGIKTLEIISTKDVCRKAQFAADSLIEGFNRVLMEKGINGCAYGESSIFHYFLGHSCELMDSCDRKKCNYDSTQLIQFRNMPLSKRMRVAMILNGVDIPGASGWVSCYHDGDAVEKTIQAFARSLEMIGLESLSKHNNIAVHDT